MTPKTKDQTLPGDRIGNLGDGTVTFDLPITGKTVTSRSWITGRERKELGQEVAKYLDMEATMAGETKFKAGMDPLEGSEMIRRSYIGRYLKSIDGLAGEGAELYDKAMDELPSLDVDCIVLALVPDQAPDLVAQLATKPQDIRAKYVDLVSATLQAATTVTKE